MEDVLQRVVAKQEIYELSCRYSRGLDRLDRELLLSVFTEGAYCEYGFINSNPTLFVDYALNALSNHLANQHMVGNHLIEFEGEQAFGEIYFNAYHKFETGGINQDMIIAGRYLDRYEIEDGQWKMAYRSERVDWSRSGPSQDPYFDNAPKTLLGERQDDAVYRRDNRCWPE
ncbi:MAG: nuclear transport factor 2 family protein [Pseudomonadales bacterium]|nr:nuclear transport factor 2 family protein [Pseudomonadales bacterium]